MADENVKGSENKSTEDTQGTSEQKTYTEEEVQALLQKEADRRVSSALKKQKEQFEKEKAEAEKLKDMDESQRREYEYQQRVSELEAKEREFTLTQNKLEATKVLANRNLPVEFVDYIVAEDAETMMANIETFEKLFNSAVSDAVSKKISSPAPKTGAVKQTGLTREAFKKLSVAQQAELYRTNPNLYKQLSHD